MEAAENHPENQGIPEITLPIRLRLAREKAGLYQEELAERIEVSRRSVANYEAGRYTPRRPVLLSWAMACGVPLKWLQGQIHTCATCGLPTEGGDHRMTCSCGKAQVNDVNQQSLPFNLQRPSPPPLRVLPPIREGVTP